MNRILKKLAFVLAFAVAFAAFPAQVHAACTVHTANTGSNNNVIFYVDETEHYNVCSVCWQKFDVTAHTDADSDSLCDGCGVTLDAGTTKHTHDTSAGGYGHMDPYGHMLVCSDTNCIGKFETHTNCVVGDNNKDGTWDCDYCGWDGVIIGGGGGGLSCTHANIRYDISETSHTEVCGDCGEPMASTVNHINDGNGTCSGCGVTVDANNEHHHDTGNNPWTAIDSMEHESSCADCSMTIRGPHGDDASNPDGLCDLCGYSMSAGGSQSSSQPRFDWDFTNGPFEVPVNNKFTVNILDGNRPAGTTVDVLLGYVDTNGDFIPYADQSGLTVTRDNNGNATQAEFDGAVISTRNELAINNGYFHVAVVVKDSSGAILASDGCDVHLDGYCSHSNGNHWTRVEKTGHQTVCNECGGNVGSLDPHTDADGDGYCDGCPAPIEEENGVLVHNHVAHPQGWFAGTSEHFYRCDRCGMTEFNPEAHVDADDNGECDICKVSLNSNLEHQCSTLVWKAEDENQHAKRCNETVCDRDYSWGDHKDTDNNDICDDCNATLDENDIHIHQPDGNWKDMDDQTHYCECTECRVGVYGGHQDNDGNGLCDFCNYDMTCYHPAASQWYGTSEGTHHLHCGYCGEALEEPTEHSDTDGNGKCDVCGVGVDSNNTHTHNWSANWAVGNNSHFHDCTDVACTTSTASMAHTDNDGDGACDICGATNKDEWCQGHSHNGDYAHYDNKHYTMCGNCDNAYGEGEAHVAGEVLTNYELNGVQGHVNECVICYVLMEDTFEKHEFSDWYGWEEDKHYRICDICSNFDHTTGENHTAGDSYYRNEDGTGHYTECALCHAPITDLFEAHTDKFDNNDNSIEEPDGFCDKCYVDVDENGVHIHEVETEWRVEEYEHIKSCISCGENIEAAEHTDANDDGACDGCGASVTEENGSFWHIHTVSSFVKINCWDHAKKCTDCGTVLEREPHSDEEEDGICDICTEPTHNLDTDCWCEDCWGYYHYDADRNCVCDACDEAYHLDDDMNCACDRCGETAHCDNDSDCWCDYCDEVLHTDANGDCWCDNCLISMHIDEDVDGLCDVCETNGYVGEGELAVDELADTVNDEIVSATAAALDAEDPEAAIEKLAEDGVISEEEAEILKEIAENTDDDDYVDVNVYIQWGIEYYLEQDGESAEQYNQAIEAIKAALSDNSTVIDFMDITVAREFTAVVYESEEAYNNGEAPKDINGEPMVYSADVVTISETPEMIQIYIRLALEPEAPEGKELKWLVYRYHDGKVDVLPVEVVDTLIGMFESDQFSVYALTYVFTDIEGQESDHNWSDDFKVNDEYHWRYCEDCGKSKKKHPHVDVNKDNHCDACDYIMEEEKATGLVQTSGAAKPVTEEEPQPTEEPAPTAEPTPTVEPTPTEQPQQPSQDADVDKAISTGGIVMGAGILAAILLILFIIFRRRKDEE